MRERKGSNRYFLELLNDSIGLRFAAAAEMESTYSSCGIIADGALGILDYICARGGHMLSRLPALLPQSGRPQRGPYTYSSLASR